MEAVFNAIIHRISTQHLDLISQYGIEQVMFAVEDMASFVGEVEEIGTSDVSCWVNKTIKLVQQNHYVYR
jgi:hypothetical protein